MTERSQIDIRYPLRAGNMKSRMDRDVTGLGRASHRVYRRRIGG